MVCILGVRGERRAAGGPERAAGAFGSRSGAGSCLRRCCVRAVGAVLASRWPFLSRVGSCLGLALWLAGGLAGERTIAVGGGWPEPPLRCCCWRSVALSSGECPMLQAQGASVR